VFVFPTPARTADEEIGRLQYTLRLRGNNVVSIPPEGTYYPFCQG
jgi:hypothetical protein